MVKKSLNLVNVVCERPLSNAHISNQLDSEENLDYDEEDLMIIESMNSFLNLEESNIVNVSINEIPPAPDCLPEDIDIIESGTNYSVIKGVRSNARLYLFDNFL